MSIDSENDALEDIFDDLTARGADPTESSLHDVRRAKQVVFNIGQQPSNPVVMLKPMIRNAEEGLGHYHALKFYDTPGELHVVVAQFLGVAFAEQQPALLIVMAEDRAGILRELEARYIDVERAQGTGDLLVLDATELMARFMIDGMPDTELFIAVVSDVITHMLHGRTDCTIRAYGGMVSDLWKTGDLRAALRVEQLWNVLARAHSVSLLCGYSAGTYSGAASAIIQEHSHVVPAHTSIWLTREDTCPACGTTIERGEDQPRSNRVYRCKFCSVELLDVADAIDFAEPAATRRPYPAADVGDSAMRASI